MTWNLNGNPYEVQSRALDKCGGRGEFGYWMEMGLGKTAVALSDFLELWLNHDVDILIVICPNTLKRNWAKEAETWLKMDPNIRVWPELGSVIDMPNIFIINYETLIYSGGEEVDRLINRYRCMVVLDESIMIKNHKAKKTKWLLQRKTLMEYRRCLSGSPIVQGPHDLWAQLTFLSANGKSNYFAFRNYFCRMGGWQGKQVLGVKKDRELELANMVDQVGFRARKDEWTDLPPKIYTERRFDLTRDQTAHYTTMRDDLIAYVQGEEIEVHMVITKIMKLQQISSGWVNSEEGEPIKIPGKNPKLDLLLELYETRDTPIVVNAHYRHSIQDIFDALDKKKIPYSFITGGMQDEDIEAEKFKFNTGEADIIICQVRSAKYGHTLLGTEDNRCATAVYYENNYSLDDRIQSEDRIHRHGQTNDSVLYIDLIGTEEEIDIIKCLQHKSNVAQSIIDYFRR
tara:strand:+ start:12482 stop:13852 length:1371 start_codon:yes stop_codon:yes gene_type:complete